VDLLHTFCELGGADTFGFDGRSLVPVLSGELPADWRKRLLVEHPGWGWNMLRTEGYTYVERDTGEKELYDMAVDPYQLESQHADPAKADLTAQLSSELATLKGCLGESCRTAENEPTP
jgi:N-acetylglucosamine-6-sulfatase